MRSEFVSDLFFTDIYDAVLIRGKKVGKIEDIVIPELPEDIEFFSASDIPGKKEIIIGKYSVPIFAFDKIEFYGQAVGVLIGKEKAKLLELKDEFEVKIAKEKTSEADSDASVFTENSDNALNPSEKTKNYDEQILDDKPENTNDKTILNEKTEKVKNKKPFYEFPILAERKFEYGDVETIFETSDKPCVSSLAFENRYHRRSEPACVKIICEENKKYLVYLPTQWPYSVAECITAALKTPKKNIEIISTNFGEHMNSLVWFPQLLACQCATASVASKKNVSICFSSAEDYNYTTCSPYVLIKHKSVVNESEKIVAMQVEVLIDAGAFCPVIDEIILQILTMSTGIYEIPNFKIEVKAYKTESNPTDFFAGLGENYILNALEKHINQIVLQKNFSPVEFRLANRNEKNQTLGGRIYFSDDLDFTALLKDICKQSDYARKYYAYKVLNEDSSGESKMQLRGIGLATGFQCSGINSFIKNGINYSVEMTITTEGKVVVKVVDCTENLKKLFSKKIAAKLEIEENNIEFVDEEEKKFNIVKTMENNILYLTNLMEKACTSIQRQRFRKPLPLTVRKKFNLTKSKNWDPEKLEGFPFMSETPAACVVELELDPFLYNIKIRNIWVSAIPDAIFKKQSVTEKIKKEIENCVSQMVLEHYSTSKFFQYRILNISDAPKIHVSLLQSNKKNSMYKGVENIANNLLPAAFASAVEQIFINNTRELFTFPITDEKIYNEVLKLRLNSEVSQNSVDNKNNSDQENKLERTN